MSDVLDSETSAALDEAVLDIARQASLLPRGKTICGDSFPEAKACLAAMLLESQLEAAKHIKELCPVTEGLPVERLHWRIETYEDELLAQLQQLTQSTKGDRREV